MIGRSGAALLASLLLSSSAGAQFVPNQGGPVPNAGSGSSGLGGCTSSGATITCTTPTTVFTFGSGVTVNFADGSAWASGGLTTPGPLNIIGPTQTGSSAQPIVNLSQTWNTSGNPTAFQLAITNTASGSAGQLFALLGGTSGSTAEFAIGKNGATGSGGGIGFLATSGTVILGGNYSNGVVTTDSNLTIEFGSTSITTPGGGPTNFGAGSMGGSNQLNLIASQIQFGAANAASPVAQTLSFQGGSGTNIAGVNSTIAASLASGNGANGNMLLEVGKNVAGSGTTQASAFPLLSLNAGTATGATVQLGDGTNFTTYDSCTALTTGATGIIACTASSRAFKDIIGPLNSDEATRGLDTLAAGMWTYKPEYQDQFGGPAEHVSLYADDVARMDPRCATYDHGQVHDYYDRCVVAYLIADRAGLKARIAELERKTQWLDTLPVYSPPHYSDSPVLPMPER